VPGGAAGGLTELGRWSDGGGETGSRPPPGARWCLTGRGEAGRGGETALKALRDPLLQLLLNRRLQILVLSSPGHLRTYVFTRPAQRAGAGST
jgi:hypothetical protein